jgi:hypothetical protein
MPNLPSGSGQTDKDHSVSTTTASDDPILAKLDALQSGETLDDADIAAIKAAVQNSDVDLDAVKASLASMDGKVATAAATSDAKANPTLGLLWSLLSAFNGTTWDRLRAGITAVSATVTGFANTLPWAIYNTTPTTRTDGQGGPLQTEADGTLRTSLATGIAGEDLTNDVLKVEARYAFTNLVGAATTTVKASAGFLHNLVINKWVSGASITIYDNTSAASTKIGTITMSAAQSSEPPWAAVYDMAFATGLTIVITGAIDVTVGWR